VLESRPLTRGFGAEVVGLDLTQPMDARLVLELHGLFDRYLVLLFRGQSLSPDAQIAFARHFGTLQTPELSMISNVGLDGLPKGNHPNLTTLLWHTDASYATRPPYATVLYAESVPATGGHTLFADTLAAYEALSEAERARLASLRVVHDVSVMVRRVGYPPPQQSKPVEHPLVRTHPPTGRRGIYLGGHVDRIVGLSDDDSAELIERLMAHTTQPEFVYEHTWQPGDLLIWDNRATLHRSTEYDTAGESRMMRRAVVTGDAPY
jgi:alpha-ketoglutarate-dependent taurine dioxygenase